MKKKSKASTESMVSPKSAEKSLPISRAGSVDLKQYYRDTIVADLMKSGKYQNRMSIPGLEKIVLNMGVGKAVLDKKFMTQAMDDLKKISGRQPIKTLAKTSIAGFKIREGYPIGCKVTLRGAAMYEFLERLLYIVLPRVRDFRGLSARSFDGHGNYTIGIKEQIVFPEIAYDKIDNLTGLNITITTTAKSDQSGYDLLKAFHFPFSGELKGANKSKSLDSKINPNMDLAQPEQEVA